MVVAVIALIVALAGTAYAAQTINGGAIKKQTIGGGKLKQKTLTGFQINTNKLGVVPSGGAGRPTPTGRSSTTRPAPGNAALARASDAGDHRRRGRRRGDGRPSRSQHQRLRQRRRPQQRRHHGRLAPASRRPTPRPPTPTRSKSAPGTRKAPTQDADFHLIVVCP